MEQKTTNSTNIFWCRSQSFSHTKFIGHGQLHPWVTICKCSVSFEPIGAKIDKRRARKTGINSFHVVFTNVRPTEFSKPMKTLKVINHVLLEQLWKKNRLIWPIGGEFLVVKAEKHWKCKRGRNIGRKELEILKWAFPKSFVQPK